MDFADILRFVLATDVPATLDLPDEMALRYKQRFDPRIDRINPPTGVLAVVSAFLLLVTTDDLPSTAVVFTILGIFGSLGGPPTRPRPSSEA